jgi:hypothetical protein
MPESQAATLLLLLSICAGLLVVLILMVLWISGRLSRIEKLIGQQVSRTDAAAQTPSTAETSPGGAFEAFLSEDPNRRKLPKSEKFSAYRKWRQEKGLNWTNS